MKIILWLKACLPVFLKKKLQGQRQAFYLSSYRIAPVSCLKVGPEKSLSCKLLAVTCQYFELRTKNLALSCRQFFLTSGK